MSKTQEKRALRKAESEDFVKQRRQAALSMFERNFEVGMKIYEDNKDKMSPEEIATLEAEIESAKKAVEDFKAKWF